VGRRRLSWCRKSLGGSCHGDDKLPRGTLCRILCVRYWYWFGERHLSPNQYQYLTHRKCCRKDIFQVADVSCLEKIVSERLGAQFLNRNLFKKMTHLHDVGK
jgi:hypothetical protein